MLARFQDFIYLRNHSKERILGVFKGMPKMSWRQFGSQDRTAVLMDKGAFAVDVSGIGACYHTDAGVGIGAGMGGDVGQKAKGLPLWTIWLAVALFIPIGAGIMPLVHWMGKKAVAATGAQAASISTNIAPTLVGQSNPPSAPVPQLTPPPMIRPVQSVPSRSVPPAVPQPQSAPVAVVETPKPAITAYVRKRSGNVTVYFSDGTNEDFPPAKVLETRKGIVILEAGGSAEFDWATSASPPPPKHSAAVPGQ